MDQIEYSTLDFLWGKPLWDLNREDAPLYTSSSFVEMGAVIPILALVFLSRRILNSIFSQLFVILVNFNKPGWEKQEPQKYRIKHNKFCSQMGKLIVHGMAAVWAYYACKDEVWWFFNTKSIIDDLYQTSIPNDPMKFSHKLYYIVLAAYHTESLLTHPFEEKRDDDIQMWIHHIVTLLLIVSSYSIGFTYFGTLVYFVHDLSDVPVAVCKVLNYSKFPAAVIGVGFIGLVSSWAYSRIYLFSRYVIYVVYYGTYKLGYKAPWIRASGVFFSVALSTLEVLHLYWFSLFFQIAKNILSGASEFDESEHRTDKEKKKKE